MLPNLRTMMLASSVAAFAAGCHDSGAKDAGEGLVVISKDPRVAIEARYHEGAHSITLRSKPDGDALKADIIDEQGRSVTEVARTIVEGRPSATSGAALLPVPSLLENAARLGTTLRLSNHGLRQLRDAIGSAAADSSLFRRLSEQTTVLHKGLIETRLELLQQWGNEARRHIAMSSEESAKFFAILNGAATAIAGTAKGQAAAPQVAPSVAIKTLLGPERYAQYQLLQNSFFSADVPCDEVLP